eukprot:1152666-Rhodomonas_salina.1
MEAEASRKAGSTARTLVCTLLASARTFRGPACTLLGPACTLLGPADTLAVPGVLAARGVSTRPDTAWSW